MENATHLIAHAGVRYWEDAMVNGVVDEDGDLIPGRMLDEWRITIELATGKVLNWPTGTMADVHYKVCDDGHYWLADASGTKIAKYRSDYVPDEYLCHGDNGYGDYIILKIGGNGQIANYQRPPFDPDRWEPA